MPDVPAPSAPSDTPRPSAEEAHDGLQEIVRAVTGRPELEIRPEQAFAEDLRVDSLAMIEIIEAAQQHFGVPVPDEVVKHLVRVGDLLDHLTR